MGDSKTKTSVAFSQFEFATGSPLCGPAGDESLSFRELARNLGATTAARYHHLGDRNKLLLLLAVEGFNRLLERLSSADASESAVRVRILALTLAYPTFARLERGYYRVMFLAEVIHPENIPYLDGPAR